MSEIKKTQLSLRKDMKKIIDNLENHEQILSTHETIIDQCQIDMKELMDKKLQESVSQLQALVTEFKNQSTPNLRSIRNNLNREKNIICFGVAETDPEKDGTTVIDIVESIKKKVGRNSPKYDIIDMHRLRNLNPENTRPLKVYFDNSLICKLLLRERIVMRSTTFYKDVTIKEDKSKAEREYLKCLSQELKQRIDRGEIDSTIKYIEGILKVITQTKNHPSSSRSNIDMQIDNIPEDRGERWNMRNYKVNSK
ncbi:hypothetical protein JTB14_030461 [Gonioctena quinquepunctata]|nr:hypothetical protein JTB14_030461 [Gonioctena quinquepunctata]